MKQLLALVIAGGLLALTTGCGPGSTTGGPDTSHPQKETKGTIIDVVTKKNIISVKPDGGGDPVAFNLSDAQITVDGVAGKKIDDLAKDQKVTVTAYETAASKVVATKAP